MERRQNGRVNVAAVDTLNALNFELHMILTSRLTIATLLPTVAVLTVASLLTVVEQHHA